VAGRRVRGVIGPAWWGLLESVGLSHDRYTRLPAWQRRGLVFALWATIAFIVVVAFDHRGSDVIATLVVLVVVGLLGGHVPCLSGWWRRGRVLVPTLRSR